MLAQILDAPYGDELVRAYAVRCIAPLPDDELKEFLVQLVQVS